MNEKSHLIIGIGGGASNALAVIPNQTKYQEVYILNTDKGVLQTSKQKTMLIGEQVLGGYGAAANMELGREAALESKDMIARLRREIMPKVVIVVSCLGGGTGSGATAVVLDEFKGEDIFCVAIVTMPFRFEGKKKWSQAMHALNDIKRQVDALVVIVNDRMRKVYGNMSINVAFQKIDMEIFDTLNGIVSFSKDISVARLRMLFKDSQSFFCLHVSDNSRYNANSTLSFEYKYTLYNVNPADIERAYIRGDISPEDVSYIAQYLPPGVLGYVAHPPTTETEAMPTLTLVVTSSRINRDELQSDDVLQVAGTTDSIAAPLSLYFLQDEFDQEEIAEIISVMSDIYREIGGDKLIIKGQAIFSHSRSLQPIDL